MWQNILGHEEIKNFLKQYIARQDKPHALLFTGAAGLGKRLLAQEFAKALLCENGKGKDDCSSCKQMDFANNNVTHPDFIRVVREVNPSTGKLKDISIEQVRDLQRETAFSPARGRYKVCLIEDVDRMRAEAANCLLKVLEEPPEGWIVILLAEDEEKLLETILSRVVVLRFHGISRESIKAFLLKRYPEMEELQAEVLAQLSEGSLGKAVKLKEGQVWETRKQALALLEAFPIKHPISYVADRSWLEKLERPEALELVSLLQLLLMDMLLLKNVSEQQIYNLDLKEELLSFSSRWSNKSLKSSLQVLEESYKALEGNASVKIALEAMILKIDKINKE